MSRVPPLLAEGRAFRAALVFALGLGQAAALGLAAFATRDLFAGLHRGTGGDPIALALLGSAGAAVALFQALGRQNAEHLGQSYARTLRHVLFSHISGMSAKEVERRRVGSLSLRFVGDLSAARGWVGLGLTRLATAAVVLPGAAVALYLLDARLALVAMAPLGVALLLAFVVAAGLGARHGALRRRRARIATEMIERIAMAPGLDLTGRTDRELARLDARGSDLRQDAVRRAGRAALVRSLPQIGAAVGGVAILWTVGREGMPAAEAAAALAVLAILVMPLQDLAGVWDRYCAWTIARQKCEALFRVPSARRRVRQRGAPVPLRVRGMWRGARAIALDIAAGEAINLIGPAGAGKSDLLAQIAGLTRRAEIEIAFDADGTTLPRIAYVGERPLVLQGSLRRAVTPGLSPRPKTSTIARTARALGLDTMLERIGGVSGRVAEGARDLSTGEQLRVELLRCILAAPDLIILDTPALAADGDASDLLDVLIDRTRATVIYTGDVKPRRSPTRRLDISHATPKSLPKPCAAAL